MAETIADEAGHYLVKDLLASKRLSAPAQLVYRHEATGSDMWMGDKVDCVQLVFKPCCNVVLGVYSISGL